MQQRKQFIEHLGGAATAPNAIWCMDFKGDFLMGRSRCYPLTVMDAYSRFLIACVAQPNTQATGVRRALRDVFAQFGLPHAPAIQRRTAPRSARKSRSSGVLRVVRPTAS